MGRFAWMGPLAAWLVACSGGSPPAPQDTSVTPESGREGDGAVIDREAPPDAAIDRNDASPEPDATDADDASADASSDASSDASPDASPDDPCPITQTLCGDECVTLATDRAHCGECERACARGLVCTMGECEVECAASLATCDSPDGGPDERFCAQLEFDPSHCGACDRACPSAPSAQPSCAAGRCGFVCEAGRGDCNGDPDDGCEASLSDDVATCGRCSLACGVPPHATATCTSGMCGFACLPGYEDCNGLAADGCEATLADDPLHCGRCDNTCSAGPNATAVCVDGMCDYRCAAGTDDCNASAVDGCEIDLTSDARHCAMCGSECASGANASAACVSSMCTLDCDDGYGDCSAATSGCETALSSNVDACGSCTNRCVSSGRIGGVECTSGACHITSCLGLVGDCDGRYDTGCETDLTTSASHCGACGAACTVAGGTGRCSRGTVPTCAVASCNPGLGDCDRLYSTGCEHDTSSDANNCGACGRVCTLPRATPACVTSACVVGSCDAGYDNCDGIHSNGCEIDIQTNRRHCGSCGHACGADEQCVAGSCETAPNPFPSTGADGAFAPTTNTVLPSGTYHFTTIDIPAGVTVTTTSPGVLDLRATSAVTIAGVIDLSGGNGGRGNNCGRSSVSSGGSGGTTGVPAAGADGTACPGECGAAGAGGSGADGADDGLATCVVGGRMGGGGGGFGSTAGTYGGGSSGGGGGGYAGGGGGRSISVFPDSAGAGASFTGDTGGCGGGTAGCGTPGGGGQAGLASYAGQAAQAR